MINRDELTPALRAEVATLIDDLRVRADEVESVADVVRQQWSAAEAAGRTAHDIDTWSEGLLAQVAVSWVLGCVFIRFCEDNGLVESQLMSGPTEEWRRWAADDQTRFFREHPADGERAYLQDVFTRARKMPGLSEVFGEHNPVWEFGPSDDACRHLIGLFRETDADGALLWDFVDDTWDTRFLGDLYQDLSDHAKKTYALLQTPDFVESFILDRTLDPAIEEFGLTGTDGGFRMIDPACGSGHFLLGGFDRLANRWLEREPAAGRRAAAARALESVFGVDLNPFAASIARFRLLVAALRFADVKTLAEAPVFAINVAVGDSLLHGPAPGRLQGVLEVDEQQSAASKHLYNIEDPELVNRFLGQDYHTVVANPPYITPKDPAANQAYRDRYSTCHRQYSLSVPFMERLFDLAVRGEAGRRAGYVGQITANSFMKREFGTKVIEKYLATQVDLTHVIDTSGAYIPGHGTPTVILIGRNRRPAGDFVRAVLGIRGEPSAPAVPSAGLVWTSIERLVDVPGDEDDFVSVGDVERSLLSKHPWSLQGGSAGPLKERLDQQGEPLERLECDIGRTNVVGEDDAWVLPNSAITRVGLDYSNVAPFVTGDVVRDYRIDCPDVAVYPYDQLGGSPSMSPAVNRFLWPNRTTLSNRSVFGKSVAERGEWFEHLEHYVARLRTPLSIAFAFVATHNHFVLDRGGKVFKQSAPVIKLPDGASVDDHLQLLGLLNSSVACFWMKQVFYPKGGDPMGSEGARLSVSAWSDRYEFDGTKLKQFPVVSGEVLIWSAGLDSAASSLSSCLPAALAERELPTADALAVSRSESARLRAEMVWLQEELDWRSMFLYGITEDDLSFDPDQSFELSKGERAFEIALARRAAAGDTTTTWFDRHDSTPITELPDHWPDWYRERIEERLALIESDRFVNLLERPEYKRRWNWEPWEELADEALGAWLLTRLEDARYWPSVEPRSVAQLADIARADHSFVQVAELYRETPDVDLVDLIGELTKSDAVPYLAAWRYKELGLRKRAVWERTWELQRREDAGEDVGKIPVPPKYASSDFLSATIWKLRGKLDVPKERFVSYPGLERDADPTAVYGWAGWDHLQQAQALAAIYNQRVSGEGWDAERVTPILAGLHELIPWLQQWHNDYDHNAGQGLGDYFADYLAAETQRNNLAASDLTDWKAPTTQRRKKKATT